MKNHYLLLAFLVLASCGKKDNPEPESPEVEAQRQRDKEGAMSIQELNQGIAVTVKKDGVDINAYIMIFDEYPDPTDVDFSQINQISPFIAASKMITDKPSYKKYGFELPVGKYMVHVIVGWPQTCAEGSICNPPKFYAIKEFEVKEGAKTTAEIDFAAIDNVTDRGTLNYIEWK